MKRTALGLAVLMLMGCATTNYGYLYRPKDASVDATARDATATSCFKEAYRTNPYKDGDPYQGGKSPHTYNELMDACMERAGFVRSAGSR